MRRRCRKCQEPLLLPGDEPQSHVARGTVAVIANDVLRKAVTAAVARFEAAPVDDGGLRKTLSSKLINEYSSRLAVDDASSQSDAERRRLTVLKIGQSGDCRGLELIKPLRSDSWKMVRQAVATAIGELGDPRGVCLVLEMLCDKEEDVIRESIRALKKLADTRSIRPLMLLGLNERLWRVQAMEAVVSFGSSGIPELLEILNERNPLTMEDSVIVLGRIGDKQAVPSLLMALNHADVGLRPKILEALGLLGDRSALGAIIGFLSAPDEKVQLSAVQAVQKIPDLRAVKPIVQILHRTQNAELRLQSVIALATSGNQKAVAILSALLPGADVVLQKAIAEALCQINSPEASETLARLLDADDLSVVVKALSGLRMNSVPSVLPTLVQLSGHPNQQVRRHAVDALVPTGDASVFNILEQRLLNDSSAEVRTAAARGLGRVGNRNAIPCLEQALQDESAVRSTAIQALSVLGDDSVIPALLVSLKDPVPEVRYHAVSGLGKLQATNAARAIRGMLDDPDEMVRLGAEKTLESLGVKKPALSHARRFTSQASRLLPDGVAGVLPTGVALAGIAGILAVAMIVWLASSSSTASTGSALAIVRAKAVTKALWIPDSTNVILLRESGPADIWDAATGQFRCKVVTSELESLGHPATLMSRRGKSLTPWTQNGVPADAQTIKLPNAKQFDVSANGAFAVYVDTKGQVVLWDTLEGTSIGNVSLKASPVPVISADGSLLAGADAEDNIVVLDRLTGKQIGVAGEAGSVVLRDEGSFSRLLFCSTGTSLAVLRSDRIVLITVKENGLESRKIDAAVHSDCVVFPNPLSIYKASGTFVSRINLKTAETQQWEVGSEQIEINCLSLSADETLAVVSAEDRKMGWVLNLEDGSSTELSPAAWPDE
ncbi:MAG: HEAT repeat domain-containing protein [Rhodopirellula sp.]|nr:HEAT repeat domain-containing protein [Rhodopirellula sp.]